jgi:hypothetical protein
MMGFSQPTVCLPPLFPTSTFSLSPSYKSGCSVKILLGNMFALHTLLIGTCAIARKLNQDRSVSERGILHSMDANHWNIHIFLLYLKKEGGFLVG